MFRPFTFRHKDALKERKLEFSLSEKLRVRLRRSLEEFDLQTGHTPNARYGDNWVVRSTLMEDVFERLMEIYGVDEIEILYANETRHRKLEGTNDLLSNAPWPTIFDTIEIFYQSLDSNVTADFQKSVNNAFETEVESWRIVDGRFLLIDKEFVQVEIVSAAQELMREHGFEGAHDEFRRARDALLSGNLKEAAWLAQSSYESVLKTILNKTDGNASLLARELKDSGFLSDCPAELQNGFVDQVLNSLPTLGNRLGRHGQGASVAEYPKEYGELALHLAATFNLFLIKKFVAQQPARSNDRANLSAPDTPSLDDDLPF